MCVQLLPCSLLQLHVCDPILRHKLIKDQNANHHVHLARTHRKAHSEVKRNTLYMPRYPRHQFYQYCVCVCLFTNTTAAAGPTNEYRSPPSRDSQQLQDKKKHFRQTPPEDCRIESDRKNREQERERAMKK